MHQRFSGSMITVAIAGAAVSVVISVSITRASAQAPASATASSHNAGVRILKDFFSLRVFDAEISLSDSEILRGWV